MRTSFVEHKGRRVVLMDFSGIDSFDEALQHIEAARLFVAAQPKVQNLLVVVDVTGSVFDSDVIDALRRLAEHDRPWVLASSVVGLSPIMRITNRIISMMSRRKFATFKRRASALDWLAAQERPPEHVPTEDEDAA